MKKTVLFFVLFAIFAESFALAAEAQAVRYEWYCKHVKDHMQPPIDKRLEFIAEYDAYYLDSRHTDSNDEDKVIYLTFDAGYENGNIEKTLDILRDENVPAAFFILQNLIAKNPDIVKRMVNEGHTVCNHTARHKDVSGWQDEAVMAELKALEGFYFECIGTVMPKYYRPPEGVFSRENLAVYHKTVIKRFFGALHIPIGIITSR